MPAPQAHRRAVAVAFAFALLFLPPLALAAPATGEHVACHVDYGGETVRLEAWPVASPYAVRVQAVGSYFLFRIVFQSAPADLATIKIYVFADTASGQTPIHQATHAYPLPASSAHWGFTGLHHVYEPLRDGELRYWCELRVDAPVDARVDQARPPA